MVGKLCGLVLPPILMFLAAILLLWLMLCGDYEAKSSCPESKINQAVGISPYAHWTYYNADWYPCDENLEKTLWWPSGFYKQCEEGKWTHKILGPINGKEKETP